MSDQAIQLMHGDCLELMRIIPSGSVDMILTDPPYCSGGNLEAQKNTKAQGLRAATVAADDFHWFASDNMGSAGLVWLLRSMMIEAARILRPNRSAFIFTDWRMVPHLGPGLESSGLRWRNQIIWDKGNAGLGLGFKPAYEVILEFCNGTPEYQVKDGQNVIRAKRLNGMQKVHNAQKPVNLLREIIRVSAPRGGVILDPFMGSGSTGVAAAEGGYGFIGIERDLTHFATAQRRLADITRGLFTL